jgi:integrase
MARRVRIGLRDVRSLNVNELLWDTSVTGFGARRQKSEAVSYVLFYRTHEGRQRWHTIGRHGAPWTPETAREEAKRLLGDVARNLDPASNKKTARTAQSVSELCDRYLADAEAGRLLTRRKTSKKASTLAIDRGRIARHIKPLIGTLKVASVTPEDIDALLHDIAAGKTSADIKTGPRGFARVRGGKGAANRAVRLLGGIFTYAVARRMRTDNPCRGVVQFADGRRERRLNDQEYGQLGDALRQASDTNMWPAAVAVARFLSVTGWRSGEALSLRWDEIDFDRRTAMLGDTKTGQSMRPLSTTACEILGGLARSGGLAFPATRGDGTVIMSGFKKQWRKIVKLGRLPTDITPHTLRHSFASVAADLEYSDITIGALIGHKGRTTTSRYAHGADTVLLAAADAVANRVVDLMGKTPKAVVVIEADKMLPRATA